MSGFLVEPRFREGDRVICTSPRWGVEAGELGTVCFADPILSGSLFDLGIRWDKEDECRHDCDGHCEQHHGLWYYEDDMALYVENEEIGDMGADALVSLLF